MNSMAIFRSNGRKKPRDARRPFGKIHYPVWFMKIIFGLVYRRAFYQQLRVFSLASSSIVDTIGTLRDQAMEAKQIIYWYVLDDIHGKLGDGTNFSRALGDWCPPSEVQLISAGSGGNRLLSDAIKRVLKRQKDMGEIRTTFIIVLLEPTVILLGTYGLFVWMSSTLVDSVLKAARGVQITEFTGSARTLVTIGQWTRGWHAFVPPVALVAIGYVIILSMPRWTGTIRRYLDVVPPWSIYRSIQGASWMQSFAMLAESKVPYVTIMRETANMSPPWLQERILAARRLMITPGMPVGAALAATGYNFPSKTIALNLKAFGARPAFSDALSEVAEEWFLNIVGNMKVASMVIGMLSMLISTFGILWIFQASNAMFSQVATILRGHYGG